AISGYGQDGPLAQRPSFDIVLQAMSGALSLNGEPGRVPTKLGLPMGDLVGGVNGPIAILSALYERERTGKGRFIDISLMDGLQGLLGSVTSIGPRASFQHQYLVPYGTFAAADGAIVIACLTPGFWGRICTALGCEELTADPRYDTLEKRRDARDEINAIVTAFTQTRTVAELVELFAAHEVPHAPILGVRDALSQPQAVHRGTVVRVEHQTLGTIPLVNRPFTFDEAMPAPAAPPVLGQHTDAVLRDVLGLDDAAIAALRAAGAVA
ncbi:MAG TPA: CoA transferase, partial [Novosphingobium sp.]|nr:CoA transferase [Novosphingobium sp.]